jgi:aminoglycoside phosphotransferase (APT) family kinase protein
MDVEFNQELVRELLSDQHPDLANLAIRQAGAGWDNAIFRLGADLAVRLPRREAAASLIEHEQRWLPQLQPLLPVAVPAPLRVGRPGCGFGWSWSVVPWLAGETALVSPGSDARALGAALGAFLRALHQPAPADAPFNPFRAIPLAERTPRLREHLQQLDGLVDTRAVLGAWDEALSAASWPGPPVWIHGDLHPGNLLIDDGRLSGVIDFGDLTAGDPATDFCVLWMLPVDRRELIAGFEDALGARLDGHSLARARGWALALACGILTGTSSDTAMRRMAGATLAAVLARDR